MKRNYINIIKVVQMFSICVPMRKKVIFKELFILWYYIIFVLLMFFVVVDHSH